MRNWSFFWKVGFVVVVLLGILVTIGFVSVLQLRGNIVRKTKDNLQSLARSNGESFMNFLQGYFQLVDFLSRDANVQGVFRNEYGEDEWMMKLFKTIKSSYADVMYVYAGLKDKRMYLVPEEPLPPDYDPRVRPWYTEASSKPEHVIVTKPYQDAVTGKTITTVAKAIRTADGIVGVVAVDFDISALSKKVLSLGQDLGFQNAVVADDGTVLLHTDEKLVGRSVRDTDFFKKWTSGPEHGVFGYVFNNQRRITGYRRLPNGWIFATLVLEKDLMSEANTAALILGFVVGLGVIFGVALTFGIIRLYVTKPIKLLVSAAERVSTGDLTVTIDFESADELGKLASVLNSTIGSLREIARRVLSDSVALKEESTHLAAASEETSATVEEISAQVDGVNSNVNNASAAIEELTSGIQEVAAAAQNVAKASQNLSEEASKVSNLASNGQKTILGVAEIIAQTKIKANETYETVQKLSESAKNIGAIVDTINSIAEQTNLLALNAAIEAARAGEAGRGFAVVADEIRKLAEESKHATGNIANILRGILDDSLKASEATRETVEIVNRAAEQSNSVRNQFQEILDSIVRMSQMVENLAASAQEQSAATEEMSSAMDNASKSMLNVVDQIGEVSTAIRQQAAALGGVAKTAENLDELAKRLFEAIARFKA